MLYYSFLYYLREKCFLLIQSVFESEHADLVRAVLQLLEVFFIDHH